MNKWQLEADKQDKEWKSQYLRKKKTKKSKKHKKTPNKKMQKLASKYSNELKSKLTPQEFKVKDILELNNIKFEYQKPFVIKGKIYISDFYLPEIRTTIEIDGFHHYHEPQKSKDKLKYKHLKSKGIDTVRFRNDEIDNDMHLFICTIKSLVK